MPGTAESENEQALVIFTIPKGTMGQDLFIDPIYRTLRNLIAKKCQCELAVFDGNTLVQRCVSSPRTVANRIRNANGNASIGPEVSNESASLLLAISNTYEQLLLARGNWLVQVNYLTEPSQHHLFLKIVDDFSTKIHNSGGFKRNIGSALLSQGFKRTILVALTHARLRQLCRSEERGSRPSFDGPQESVKKPFQPKDSFIMHSQKLQAQLQHLSGDWGEISSNTEIEVQHHDTPRFQKEAESGAHTNTTPKPAFEAEPDYIDSLRKKFDAHHVVNKDEEAGDYGISDDEDRGISVSTVTLESSTIGGDNGNHNQHGKQDEEDYKEPNNDDDDEKEDAESDVELGESADEENIGFSLNEHSMDEGNDEEEFSLNENEDRR